MWVLLVNYGQKVPVTFTVEEEKSRNNSDEKSGVITKFITIYFILNMS
jgi:hypothetical protein